MNATAESISKINFCKIKYSNDINTRENRRFLEILLNEKIALKESENILQGKLLERKE